MQTTKANAANCLVLTRIDDERASQDATAAPKRTKTGHRSRADAVSMGPGGLDRKNVTVLGCVRTLPLRAVALPRVSAPILPCETGLSARFDASLTPLWQAMLAGCGRSALVVRRRRFLT
jgi:hypothetical protein